MKRKEEQTSDDNNRNDNTRKKPTMMNDYRDKECDERGNDSTVDLYDDNDDYGAFYCRDPINDFSMLRDAAGQAVTVSRLLRTKPLQCEISKRAGPGNKSILYLSGESVTRTLNAIFGVMGWNLTILKSELLPGMPYQHPLPTAGSTSGSTHPTSMAASSNAATATTNSRPMTHNSSNAPVASKWYVAYQTHVRLTVVARSNRQYRDMGNSHGPRHKEYHMQFSEPNTDKASPPSQFIRTAFREDMGAGDAVDRNLATACAHALKASITDALKRAARHFGDKLGNSLYDGKFQLKSAPKSIHEALIEADQDAVLKLRGIHNGSTGSHGTKSINSTSIQNSATIDDASIVSALTNNLKHAIGPTYLSGQTASNGSSLGPISSIPRSCSSHPSIGDARSRSTTPPTFLSDTTAAVTKQQELHSSSSKAVITASAQPVVKNSASTLVGMPIQPQQSSSSSTAIRTNTPTNGIVAQSTDPDNLVHTSKVAIISSNMQICHRQALTNTSSISNMMVPPTAANALLSKSSLLCHPNGMSSPSALHPLPINSPTCKAVPPPSSHGRHTEDSQYASRAELVNQCAKRNLAQDFTMNAHDEFAYSSVFQDTETRAKVPGPAVTSSTATPSLSLYEVQQTSTDYSTKSIVAPSVPKTESTYVVPHARTGASNGVTAPLAFFHQQYPKINPYK
jgi:recombination DNA repair RAD52 pathway protein